MSDKFLVTLDSVSYTSKPEPYIGAITRRVQSAGATECDAAEFAAHVAAGRSWVGGTYAPEADHWGEFLGQQIFALDFDNKVQVNGKDKQARYGEAGYIDPQGVHNRCDRLGVGKPFCTYITFSADPMRDWLRFRAVIDCGEVLDEADAKEFLAYLLRAFPEADQRCKNLNRIFFGTNGEVWRLDDEQA